MGLPRLCRKCTICRRSRHAGGRPAGSQAWERVLDLGCGDGALTEKLAAAGCAVVGADSSADLIRAARARNLDARLMNGEALDFDGEFDAVFSNAALHWMLQPDKVIEGVYRALKPGGRFVGEFGGAGNVLTIASALETALNRRGIDGKAANPWYFPTAEDYAAKLAAHGFRVRSAELIERPTPLPTGMAGWLATFAGAFRQGPGQRARGSAERGSDRNLARPDETGRHMVCRLHPPPVRGGKAGCLMGQGIGGTG